MCHTGYGKHLGKIVNIGDSWTKCDKHLGRSVLNILRCTSSSLKNLLLQDFGPPHCGLLDFYLILQISEQMPGVQSA